MGPQTDYVLSKLGTVDCMDNQVILLVDYC